MKKILLITTIITLTLLSACNQQTETTQKQQITKLNPCKLITQTDIKKIFPNTKLIPKNENPKPNAIGQTICFYTTDNDEMKFIQIDTIQRTPTKTYTIENLFNDNKKLTKNIKEISNIGDSSYYGGLGLKIGAGLHTLIKEKNLTLGINIGLGINNNDDKRHLALEKYLTEKILKTLQ